jgi:hypothetical protein
MPSCMIRMFFPYTYRRCAETPHGHEISGYPACVLPNLMPFGSQCAFGDVHTAAESTLVMESVLRTDSYGLERRDRVDDLICGHNGAGVVWDIDVESGVHLFIRVVRGRVFYRRDLEAQLSGITNRGLHTRVCYESHDDELMDAMFLELQTQIRVGETTGTPMLEGHDFARLRLELARISPPHVPYSKLFRNHAAFWTGAMDFQVS